MTGGRTEVIRQNSHLEAYRDKIVEKAHYWASPGEWKPAATDLCNFFIGSGSEDKPSLHEAEEALQRGAGVKVKGQMKQWCGVFACYVLREGGLRQAHWTLIGGKMLGIHQLWNHDGMQPGDVAILGDKRKPRSLTVEQFRSLLSCLREPHGTIALMCICFGLRISECLALRWSDIDWLNKGLRVERGIVEQNVDDVKTDESRKSLAIADELLERLSVWRQTTGFSADSDWVFASPAKIGRLPYSYTGVWRELDRASKAAGLGHIGTHTFRHSYRTWIDAIGTPVEVQQKLMRHSDIRTTMTFRGRGNGRHARSTQ